MNTRPRAIPLLTPGQLADLLNFLAIGELVACGFKPQATRLRLDPFIVSTWLRKQRAQMERWIEHVLLKDGVMPGYVDGRVGAPPSPPWQLKRYLEHGPEYARRNS